jgi:hypothetical protein
MAPVSDPNDFRQPTKLLLERRSGNTCSNPTCRHPTSGPDSSPDGVINLGEAAHIRGARSGSARYDATMTSTERSVITNGIWLCCTCAKLIDSDADSFTVDVLHVWKRKHEENRTAALGLGIRFRLDNERLITLFRRESPASLQIALDKPEYWEHLLFIELARSKLRIVRESLDDLKDDVVVLPKQRLEVAELPRWVSTRTEELRTFIDVLRNIVEDRIAQSSGPDGRPSDPEVVLRAANLLAKACEGLLEWEREVARTIFPQAFDDLRRQMRGWTHGFFSEMEKIPGAMSVPIEQRVAGQHTIVIAFRAPSNMEAFGAEFVRRYGDGT